MKRTLLILLFSSLLYSCKTENKNPGTTREAAAIKSQVSQILDQVDSACESCNITDAIRPYWNNPEFFAVESGQVMNYNQLLKSSTDFFARLDFQKLTKQSVNYKIISRKAVIVTSVYCDTLKMKNGPLLKVEPYTAISLFEKINGVWKITFYSSSATAPVTVTARR